MKDKTLLTILLCTVVVLLAVVYAAFSTQLSVNGTASIGSKWEVAFDKEASSCTAGGSITSITDTVAQISAELVSPGDSVTCTFIVKNSGTLNAKLDSITSDTTGNAPITISVLPTTEQLAGRAVLAASKTEAITVTMTYDSVESQPENTTKSVTVAAIYKQAFNNGNGGTTTSTTVNQ